MDGEHCQNAEREMFLRLWKGLTTEEHAKLCGVFNSDSDRHNAYKKNVLGVLRAPSNEEYRNLKKLRCFIKKLKPAKVVRKEKYTGSDSNDYFLNCCNSNCIRYKDFHKSEDLSFIFGFRVWMSAAVDYFFAEGHVWLRNEKTGEWIDPSPFPDKTDVAVLLVESPIFLAAEERAAFLQPPFSKVIPSILSCNTRILAGCQLVDPVFLNNPLVDYCDLSKLHLVKPNGVLTEPPNDAKALRRHKIDRKDKQFWHWRQGILNAL
mmetsp:Transcript_3533/g.4436  ORF Transcript_3533/g.4436 Transcript_3533/m.4436 type:complete len:263 (-) Transcript_3533:169-957(-)